MKVHIYKIEEDRTADCSEIFVYGAFSVDEVRRKADFIWRYLTESERKRADISAQGFDLDTNALPESLLDELGLERGFDPRKLQMKICPRCSPILTRSSCFHHLMLCTTS